MHVICFTANSHITNFIGIKYLKAKKVTLIVIENKHENLSMHAIRYYYEKEHHLPVRVFKTQEKNIANDLKDMIATLSNATIILPKVEYASDLMIMEAINALDCNKFFIEPDGDIYHVVGLMPKLIRQDDVDLKVSDFIRQTGGKIIASNNTLFDSKAANELLDYMLKHHTVFSKLLKYVKPMKSHPKKNHYASPSPVSDVFFDHMTPSDANIYTHALQILENNNILRISKHEERWEVFFIELDYRDYFSKSGTWLEHLVLRTVKEIKGIDDVQSSVFFTWDKRTQYVKNEIDVMATFENRLIAISCKDSKNIVDEYLYELESHSMILNEDGAVKIIATTAELTPFIIERAELLKINIVRFDGNISEFKKQIEKCIFN